MLEASEGRGGAAASARLTLKGWFFMKKLVIAMLAAACALALAGCNAADVYDNDEEIASSFDSIAATNDSSELDEGLGVSSTFEGLSGKATVARIETTEGAAASWVTFSIDLAVDSGRLKVVSVSPDGSVETLLEGTGSDTVTIDLGEGEYAVKVIADSAAGSYSVELNEATGATCTFESGL